MNHDSFIAQILENPFNRAILERLPALELPDCWLVSGALFQTIWNIRTNRPVTHGIRDYDIFYFDPDLSWEAEDRAIAAANEVLGNLGVPVEVRNQARVHLWYEAKFARPYPPLQRAADGIDRFLMPCAQVGIRRHGEAWDIYAPAGLDDIEGLTVRPNLTANFNIDRFREKAERWRSLWPELRIVESQQRDITAS